MTVIGAPWVTGEGGESSIAAVGVGVGGGVGTSESSIDSVKSPLSSRGQVVASIV